MSTPTSQQILITPKNIHDIPEDRNSMRNQIIQPNAQEAGHIGQYSSVDKIMNNLCDLGKIYTQEEGVEEMEKGNYVSNQLEIDAFLIKSFDGEDMKITDIEGIGFQDIPKGVGYQQNTVQLQPIQLKPQTNNQQSTHQQNQTLKKALPLSETPKSKTNSKSRRSSRFQKQNNGDIEELVNKINEMEYKFVILEQKQIQKASVSESRVAKISKPLNQIKQKQKHQNLEYRRTYNISRPKKLNFASSILAYNYTTSFHNPQQTQSNKQKNIMTLQISQLNNIIQILKKQKNKHQTIITGLQSKIIGQQHNQIYQKELNVMLVNAKSDIKELSKTTERIRSAKQIIKVSSITNPEQKSNYKQFRAYPLSQKGIIVREILHSTEKQKQKQSHSHSKHNRNCSFEPSSPISEGNQIFQLQFVKQSKKKPEILQQQHNLTSPNIKISSFVIPQLPKTPSPNISQQNLLKLFKQICSLFNLSYESDHQISIKKYKNCIIFKTSDPKKKIVWHYSGKFYIGGWDQNQQGEGKKNGEGFEYSPQKHWYQGQFFQGKRNGSGTMIMENDNIYKGQWLKGMRHGLGTFYDKNSNILYEGQWKANMNEGKGILKKSQSQFYEGIFQNEIKHGYGLEVFKNGDYYKGEYKMGHFHGKGKYVWKTGASYNGQFVNGKRQGTGTWKSGSKDYDVYYGEYKNDKKCGKGEYIWNNENVYVGYFFNDDKHGDGKVEYPDGREIRGFWQYGKLVHMDKKQHNSDSSSQIKCADIKFSTFYEEPIIPSRLSDR